MFERYTEKARRVIFFARYEASQLGSPDIETEHLLLGLLRENAATLSRHSGRPIDAEDVREEILKHVSAHKKVSTSVDLPLSDESKRILAYAAEEAERLGHKYIGTEHLLLGILREKDCLAARLLRKQGFDLDHARKSIEKNVQESGAAGSIGTGSGGGVGFAQGSGGIPIGLVEASPSEFLLTHHRGQHIPRIGETISIHRESATETTLYRVEDVIWQFDRASHSDAAFGASHLKTVRFKVSKVDSKTEGS